MGSSSTPKKQTTVSEVKLPSWLSQGYQDLFNRSTESASQPYQPYTGSLVAGLSPEQLQGGQSIQALQGLGTREFQDLYTLAGSQGQASQDQLASLYGQYGAYANPYVAHYGDLYQQSLQGPDPLEAYLSPYTSSVIEATTGELARQRDIEQAKNASNAMGAGAWGGSRSGIQQAETARGYADIMANKTAALNQANYEQARANQLAFDANRRAGIGLAGQLTGNQIAALQSQLQGQAGINQQAAAQQAAQISQQQGLTDAQRNAAMQDIDYLQKQGALTQGVDQAQLQAQYEQYLREQGYPQQQLSWLADLYGSTPYGGGSTQTSPNPNQGNPLSGALGGAAMGGGLYAAGAITNPWLIPVMAGAGYLASR